MEEIELPYLAWPEGRGGIEYPTYRRDGLLRQLKTPDGKRLKGPRATIRKDTRVVAAWVPIHEQFEQDKEREKPSPEKRPVQWTYRGSIAHAVDDWLVEEVANLSINTQKLYNIYAREIRAAHGHRPAVTMPRDAVVKMVNERRKKTPGAAQNLANTLQALFAYIEDHPATFGLSDDWRNPTVARRQKKGKRGSKKKTGWAPWEEWQIDEFRKHWAVGTFERAEFEGYLATGQRGCDVASMRREHYRGGVIAVVQQKTGARAWIPVSDDFQPVLDPWLASHDSEFLFPAPDGIALSTGAFEARLRRAIKAVKALPSSCKPHGLRYTFATRAIELSKIEKRIGHQTIGAIVGHRTLEMALKYTQQKRDSELVIDTMNVGTAAYREHHQNPEN